MSSPSAQPSVVTHRSARHRRHFSCPGTLLGARLRGRAGHAIACLATLLATGAPVSLWAASSPYRGLWVGQVTVNHVNEVTIPLDEDNIAIAPDPNVPTPTSDQAHLRLILHVNGAGQVTLLKDCAILARTGHPAAVPAGGGPVDINADPSVLEQAAPALSDESDLSLVTDERLYTDFPPQPAVRFASAVFDFGEGRATLAVHTVISNVVEAVATHVASLDRADLLSSPDAQQTAREDAAQMGSDAATPIIEAADAARAFFDFRNDHLSPAQVTAIAEATTPADEAEDARNAAIALRDSSFFGDTRGLEMIDAILAAIDAAPTPEEKLAAAHNVAAAYADVTNEYQRFISGLLFGDMISGAASSGATAVLQSGATAASVRNAINGNTNVVAARSAALGLDANIPYNDNRAASAVEMVIEAISAEVIAFLAVDPKTIDEVRAAGEAAGRAVLADAVARYPIPATLPSPDYNEFVTSDVFEQSGEAAAEAAAEAAVLERVTNPLALREDLVRVARDAAIDALRSTGQDALGAAALTTRTELPLRGTFGPGQGDTRLTFDIRKNGLPPLGPQALEGTIFLPADHPTNPFRHRRHPDHATGFDIRREIALSFDGTPTDPLASAGYGVDRITGTYREEIHGLHKPLGPDRNIGLKVEGRFELNRVSLIDTLNAR